MWKWETDEWVWRKKPDNRMKRPKFSIGDNVKLNLPGRDQSIIWSVENIWFEAAEEECCGPSFDCIFIKVKHSYEFKDLTLSENCFDKAEKKE